MSGPRDATRRLSAGAIACACGQARRGARRLRGGISLLEVLFSLGVLFVGLLGVAAIIPVARFQIVETAKADRSAATGQAMLHQAKVWQMGNYRSMLDAYSWRDVFLRVPPTPPQWTQVMLPLNNQKSYAIDPLFIANNSRDPVGSGDGYALHRIRSLPYWPVDYDPTARTPGQQMFMHELTMQRVTLAQTVVLPGSSPAVNIARQLLVSQRDCTWRDDLLIRVPSDKNDRPRQEMRCSFDDGGTLRTVSAALPARAEDFASGAVPASLSALVPETAGYYSWMVTVTPAVGEANSWTAAANNPYDPNPYPASNPTAYPAFNFESRRQYTISVAVFYRRDVVGPSNDTRAPPLGDPQITDPDKPPERTVMATFLGSGHGGGDVRLVAPPTLAPTDPDYAKYLEVKQGEWLLLAGTAIDERPRYADSSIPLLVDHYVFKWYRIAALGEIQPGPPPSRMVTLEGPDWKVVDGPDRSANYDPSHLANEPEPSSWCLRYHPTTGVMQTRLQDLNGDGTPDANGRGGGDVQACLFDGIIGVYTTTVELE